MSIFSLTYLYLPLFTYIWLYLGLITLIWAYLPLIALILPYVPYSPYILHFEDLGDTSVVSEYSLSAILVIDIYFFTSIKFERNRTITYGDIAF